MVQAIDNIMRKIGFENQFFSFLMLFSLFVPLLYLAAPSGNSEVFPNLSGSRFLWTELIPLSILIVISISVYLGLSGKLNHYEMAASCLNAIFLIFLSLQFSTVSPVGVDGWFFLSNAQYFSLFGQNGVATYMSHPLVMYPVDLWIRTFGGSGVFIASSLGLLMSMLWTFVIITSTTESKNFDKFGSTIFVMFGLFFLISGWYPLRYSSHLLGLLLGHFLIHRISEKIRASDIIIATLLSISHPFSPIIFSVIFYVDSVINRNRRGSYLGVYTGLIFLLWNVDLIEKILYDVGYGQTQDLLIYTGIAGGGLIGFSLIVLVDYFIPERFSKFNFRGTGVRNVSVLIGALFCIPILLFADSQTGSARFTHRLLTYSIVPIIWILHDISSFADEFLEKLTEVNLHGVDSKSLIIVIFSMSMGFGSSIMHVNFVTNAEVMPEESVHCWDMVENSGALGLLSENGGEVIVISDQIHPPLKSEMYYRFAKTGDGSRLPSLPQDKIVGVLETPDLFLKLNQFIDFETEEWSVVGEVGGACRLWLPDGHQTLDPSITWEAIDALKL